MGPGPSVPLSLCDCLGLAGREHSRGSNIDRLTAVSCNLQTRPEGGVPEEANSPGPREPAGSGEDSAGRSGGCAPSPPGRPEDGRGEQGQRWQREALGERTPGQVAGGTGPGPRGRKGAREPPAGHLCS